MFCHSCKNKSSFGLLKHRHQYYSCDIVNKANFATIP